MAFGVCATIAKNRHARISAQSVSVEEVPNRVYLEPPLTQAIFLPFLGGTSVSKLSYSDVFVPGGFPSHTYNPRQTLQLEDRLREVTKNLCKLATITGHTKSGKTVLARTILPREESLWIDGGVVSEEDDFWHVIIEQLELFPGSQVQSQKELSSSIGAKGSAAADFIVAKGSGEVSGSMGNKRSSSATASRSLSSRVVALKGLRKNRIPLVVDDFHYIPVAMQGSIVRALKPLVFDGLPVVIIAIPHRRYDAMKVEREMTGRIFPIQIPIWTEDELRFIPKTGFALLNYDVDHDILDHLASEAIGSPHLMQDFCRTMSRTQKVTRPQSLSKLILNTHELELVFREVAETIGRPIFEKLAKGPRQRTDRLPRTLKNTRVVDIYELVLHALAHIKPGLVTLEYEDLRTSIREVTASAVPQLHEIARVLKHMATIAATDQSSTPVIDFEESDKKLHITDPFFAFYLRWGELAG
jgi:hypothetical protein